MNFGLKSGFLHVWGDKETATEQEEGTLLRVDCGGSYSGNIHRAQTSLNSFNCALKMNIFYFT